MKLPILSSCKFPFEYKGNEFKGCIFTYTPSEGDKSCARARESTDLVSQFLPCKRECILPCKIKEYQSGQQDIMFSTFMIIHDINNNHIIMNTIKCNPLQQEGVVDWIGEDGHSGVRDSPHLNFIPAPKL